MAAPKLTILLSGMIAGVPHQGGATWAVLQYLLGFKRLGHDVYFIEPIEEAALRPVGAQPTQSEEVRSGVRWLFRRYDRVIEVLMSLPVTFIHGEFYASNVLVQARGGEPLRVCPIDWERAAVGPGLMDLAALVTGGWSDEERVALAMAYHAARIPNDGWSPTPEVFLTMLDYCRLHLAVRWLGWFGRRRQFRMHAQDWLGEALGLAEKLGLA